MRSASVAEWMVSRCTGEERAASIVGDLVELKPRKSSLWFWLSIAGVLLSLTWRKHTAVIAAFIAAYWVVIALNEWSRPLFTSHTHPLPHWEWGYFVAVTGCLLGWMAVFYTAIRYSFSDELTQFTLVWTGIMTAVCFGWQQPVVWTLCIILTVGTIAACVVWDRWRRAARTLFVSMLTGLMCFTMSGFVVFWYHSFVFHRGMGHGELHWAYTLSYW